MNHHLPTHSSILDRISGVDNTYMCLTALGQVPWRRNAPFAPFHPWSAGRKESREGEPDIVVRFVGTEEVRLILPVVRCVIGLKGVSLTVSAAHHLFAELPKPQG